MFIFYIAGKQATDRLLAQGNITQQTKVLEVACNRGTTMLELAQKYDCQVIGIDLDAKVVAKAKENIKRYGLEEKLSVQQGNAFKLPFAAETFDIVINEVMLTMFPDVSKQKALAEYYRVLKPGGKLLTHDVSLIKENLELVAKLGQTINVHVTPLTRRKWEERFKQ